jgi:hypothetical protein
MGELRLLIFLSARTCLARTFSVVREQGSLVQEVEEQTASTLAETDELSKTSANKSLAHWWKWRCCCPQLQEEENSTSGLEPTEDTCYWKYELVGCNHFKVTNTTFTRSLDPEFDMVYNWVNTQTSIPTKDAPCARGRKHQRWMFQYGMEILDTQASDISNTPYTVLLDEYDSSLSRSGQPSSLFRLVNNDMSQKKNKTDVLFYIKPEGSDVDEGDGDSTAAESTKSRFNGSEKSHFLLVRLLLSNMLLYSKDRGPAMSPFIELLGTGRFVPMYKFANPKNFNQFLEPNGWKLPTRNFEDFLDEQSRDAKTKFYTIA